MIFSTGGLILLAELDYIENDNIVVFMALGVGFLLYVLYWEIFYMLLKYCKIKKVRLQIEKNFLEWQKNNPNDDRTPFVKKLVYE